MIANIPNKVRQLYWEALLDIGVDNVRSMTQAKNIARFLGGVLRHYILKFDLPNALSWLRKIVIECPVSSSLVIAIMLTKESVGLIPKIINKAIKLFPSTGLIVLFKR